MSNTKEVRKQLKNILQENPEILTKELESELFKRLESRVKELEDHVKKTLHEINTRHKDTMDYLLRHVSRAPKQD